MKTKAAARLLCALLCVMICLGTFPTFAEGTPEGLETFKVRNGSRSSPKIALTMDDVNEREWVWKSVELCRQYGITMTFLPNGINLHEEDRDSWRDVVDSGCEIASHGMGHLNIGLLDEWSILGQLGRFQQRLDEVLGYHYQVRWFRPPFGNTEDENKDTNKATRTIRRFGYDHALMWDVSQTVPEEAMKRVKNGSILLFHARKKDYECLQVLIPWLLDAGYEPVTVSALFGFDPPETGDELYVYNKEDYKNKK